MIWMKIQNEYLLVLALDVGMTNCITLNTYIIDDITCNVGLLSKKLFAMIVHK